MIKKFLIMPLCLLSSFRTDAMNFNDPSSGAHPSFHRNGGNQNRNFPIQPLLPATTDVPVNRQVISPLPPQQPQFQTLPQQNMAGWQGGSSFGRQPSMFNNQTGAFPPPSNFGAPPQQSQQFRSQQPQQSQLLQRNMDGRLGGCSQFGQLPTIDQIGSSGPNNTLPPPSSESSSLGRARPSRLSLDRKDADSRLLAGINLTHVGKRFTVDKSVEEHYNEMYFATFCALQFKLLRKSTPKYLDVLSKTSLESISGFFGKAFACCKGGRQADLTLDVSRADNLADNLTLWVSYLVERYIYVYMSGGALASNGFGQNINSFIRNHNSHNLLIPSSELFVNMVKKELNIADNDRDDLARLNKALPTADAIVRGFDMQTWLYYIQRDLWAHKGSDSKTGVTTLKYDDSHLYPHPSVRSELIRRVSKTKSKDVAKFIEACLSKATSQENPNCSNYWFQSALPMDLKSASPMDLNRSRPGHRFPEDKLRPRNAESEQTGTYPFKSKEEIDAILVADGFGDVRFTPHSSSSSSSSPSSSDASRTNIGPAKNTGSFTTSAPQQFGSTGGFPLMSNNNTSGSFPMLGNGFQGQPQQSGFQQFGQNWNSQPGGNQFLQGQCVLNSGPSTFGNGGFQPSPSFGSTGGFPSMSNNNTSSSFSTWGNGFQGQPQQSGSQQFGQNGNSQFGGNQFQQHQQNGWSNLNSNNGSAPSW